MTNEALTEAYELVDGVVDSLLDILDPETEDAKCENISRLVADLSFANGILKTLGANE